MATVLILDHDTPFGHVLERSLKRTSDEQYDITVVRTPRQATDAIATAERPFDILLVDQYLGSDIDGITVLESLLKCSPSSDAVVFTKIGDLEAAMRAYRLGVYRYLHKPFSVNDLEFVLQSLLARRQALHERDRLRDLIVIGDDAQRARTLSELGSVIVRGGCSFGFARARLWLCDEAQNTVTGIDQVGNDSLPSIATLRIPIAASPYLLRANQSDKPLVFQGQEYGPGYLAQHFHEHGYTPPEGEWVCIPLRLRDTLRAILVLDNAFQPQHIQPSLCQHLQLLGNHFAAALDRVQTVEEEKRITVALQRQHDKSDVLAEIGRLVSQHAAQFDLERVLHHVRKLIGRLIDVQNFFVAILDDQQNKLLVQLEFKYDQPLPPFPMDKGIGLTSYVISQNQPLLLTGPAVEAFTDAHAIQRLGEPAHCWLGVPLSVVNNVIGAIVVQSFDDSMVFTEDDKQTLMAIANQIAGTVYAVRLRERDQIQTRKLHMLNRAVGELRRLAELREDALWHATLTVATANYGFCFNRAMLFLVDHHAYLSGYSAIGQLAEHEARYRWEEDERNRVTFDSYLNDLETQTLVPTELHDVVRSIRLKIDDLKGAVADVLHHPRQYFISPAECAEQLPPAFVSQFGSTAYALLPVRVGKKVLGFVMVDNIHDQKRLDPGALRYLETLLAQAALEHDNQRQRVAMNHLADVSHQVLANIANQRPGVILEQICTTSQEQLGADCVAIYPLVRDRAGRFLYDIDNMASAGLSSAVELHHILREGGITTQILDSGSTLAIGDIAKTFHITRTQIEQHTFIGHEQLRAFIGMPIRMLNTNEIVGVMYLGFRSPQTFDESDERQARWFADLAGAALHTGLAEDHLRRELDAATQGQRERDFDLKLLQTVMETALLPSQRLDSLIHRLLTAAKQMLDIDHAQIALILRQWKQPQLPHDKAVEISKQYYLLHNRVVAGDGRLLFEGLTGNAIENGEDRVVDDVRAAPWNKVYVERPAVAQPPDAPETRSEMDVLIRRRDSQIIGVFNVESPLVGAFTHEHHQRLRRLATCAALALDNVRRQENLHNVLELIKAMLQPSSLDATLQAVLKAARLVAPGVDTVMIWYRHPADRRFVPGPRFGMLRAHDFVDDPLTGDNVLTRVINSEPEIWASDVRNDDRLHGRFVVQEHIASTAVFQLLVEDPDPEIVGLIFFNYRVRHDFTAEERALLPMLAAVAAASVRDALRLKKLDNEHELSRAARDIAVSIGSEPFLADTLPKVFRTMQASFPGSQIALLSYNAAQHILEFHPSSEGFYAIEYPDRSTYLDINKPHAGSLACLVASKALHHQSFEPLNIGDVRAHPQYLETISRTQSEMCVALGDSKDRLLGVLVVEHPKLNAYDQQHENLFQIVGRLVSMLLERSRNATDLRFQTLVSGVTAWAADLAHDLRSDVGTIQRKVPLLEQHATPEQRQHLAELRECADRLDEWIVIPWRTPTRSIQIDPWLRTVIADLASKQIAHVQPQFALQTPNVWVDLAPALLERALRHLIRNAAEAIKGQNGTGVLQVRTQQHNGNVDILISNSGPDIPASRRQQLFVEQTSSKENPHNKRGLGLLLVRSMIEQMGGSIRLASKPGEPVTFAIQFACAANQIKEVGP